MSSVNYSVTGNPFQKNLGDSLSTLQQNQELVDMTLAADGHFVKVHQLVIALASPYLKQLIASAPCQHPIIFLNNVSSQNLCLLLEYIYTGEAMVPEDCMQQFIDIGKLLHVRGLEDLVFRQTLNNTKNSTRVERVECNPIKRVKHTHLDSGHSIKKLALTRGSEMQQVTVPALAKNIKLSSRQTTLDRPNITRSLSLNSQKSTPLTKSLKPDREAPTTNTMQHYNSEDDDDDSNDPLMDETDKPSAIQPVQPATKNDKSTVQFTISERGCLQVILNRFIYNYTSLKKSGVRRWRCSDYRKRKCLAFVTTQGNMVLSRANIHNHFFHDKKILDKITKNCVFTAIDEAECFAAEESRQDDDKDQEVSAK